MDQTKQRGLQFLEKRLQSIKDGNMVEKEDVIRDYMPFIVKCVSKCIGRYLGFLESEEFSVGLIAFDEAIQRYDFEKGNFIAYAELVISSRIKDFIKKENRNNDVPLSYFDDDYGNAIENSFATKDFTHDLDIKNQMREFKEQLAIFGISIEKLVDDSPKHKDTRLRALAVARHIGSNHLLKNEFYKKKKLPYSQIRVKFNLSQKAIRKSREFIIAAVMIFSNDWPDLKNQLPDFKGGEVDAD